MKRVDLLELSDEARDLVRQCEISGARSLFVRDERPVAVLISFDEYVALRETIDIANDTDARAAIDAGSADAQRGAMDMHGDRIFITDAADRSKLAEHENHLVDEALAQLHDDPIAGAPLFEPLKGLWCYRAEHLRIVYTVQSGSGRVVILSIERSAPVTG